MEVMRAVGGKKLLVYKGVLHSVVFLVLQLSYNIYASSIYETETQVGSSAPVSSSSSVECKGIFTDSEVESDDIGIQESTTSLNHKIQDRVNGLVTHPSFDTVKSILEGVYLKDKILMVPVHTFRHEFRTTTIPYIINVLFSHILSKIDDRHVIRRADESRVWNLEFITENLDIIFKQNLDKLKNMNPKGQVDVVLKALKTQIKDRLNGELETIIRKLVSSNNMESLWDSTGYYYKVQYASLVTKYLQKEVESVLVSFLNEYQQKYKELVDLDIGGLLSDIKSQLISGINFEASIIEYSSSVTDKNSLNFFIPNFQILGRFEPSLSSFILYKNETDTSYEPHFSLLHGAGTLSSNFTSYMNLIPRLSSSFFTSASAADLPGSMGDQGILPMNLSTNPYEISAFLDKWFTIEQAKRSGPQIAFGRSLGSTYAFTNALIHAVLGTTPPVDMYMLTSFSTPNTMEEQWDIVTKLSEVDPSVQIIDGIRDSLLGFSSSLLSILDQLKETNPEILEQLGNNMLFVQGEVDSDGGADPVGNLLSFTKTYAPTASIYIIPDPLKDHPEVSSKLGADRREASHFLLNARGNEEESMAKKLGIDPKYLPRFYDQSVEVIALSRLWLDFIIDMSPTTPSSLMTRLSEKRKAYTGSDSKFSYFKKFISDLNKTKKLNLDLEKIALNEKPGSDSIAQRIKRVILFVQEEYEKKCKFHSTSCSMNLFELLKK